MSVVKLGRAGHPFAVVSSGKPLIILPDTGFASSCSVTKSREQVDEAFQLGRGGGLIFILARDFIASG